MADEGRRSRWITSQIALVVVLVLLGWLAAPATLRDDGSPGLLEVDLHQHLRARALRTLTTAFGFKPAAPSIGGLEAELAPLLLIEPVGERDQDGFVAFGAIAPGATGVPDVEDAPGPTIYATTSTVALNGVERPQVVYRWWHEVSAQGGSAASWQHQGVRITLDRAGRPAIWEVLHDRSGLTTLYVSKKLEEEARTSFGPPLDGRTFSVEAPREAAPDVVVVRVLSDGPMPMGPWVYEVGASRDVATLLCRCMASQVDEVTGGMQTYELVPAPALGGLDPASRLETVLRLSASF